MPATVCHPMLGRTTPSSVALSLSLSLALAFPGLFFLVFGGQRNLYLHPKIQKPRNPSVPQAVPNSAPLDPAPPSGSQLSIVSVWSRRIEFSAYESGVGVTAVLGYGTVWFCCAGSCCVGLGSTAGASSLFISSSPVHRNET